VLYFVLGSALVFYGVVVGGLYIFQRNLLYLPNGARPGLGEAASLGVREVKLATADGLSLLSWYLSPRDCRPVIVYFHGNGGHIGYRRDRLLAFAQSGYGVLMVEYRGYGGNPGTPSENGLFTDALAALDFLVRTGIETDRLVLYGESLGSGVAVRLAAQHQVAALILEAPFTSIADVAQFHYPFVPASVLVRDRFDSFSRIGAVRAPILFLHGTRDRVVPLRYGRALFDAAPQPKQFWLAREGGHEDLARFGALDAVRNFIDGGIVECPKR
jgi:uncharacterized protein